jgi:hypothetical protein
MTGVKTAMMKAAMTGLYHTGAHRLLAPYTRCIMCARTPAKPSRRTASWR